jgi:hypothetical protein
MGPTLAELRHAQQRVGTDERAIRWALAFIDIPLNELLDAEKYVLQLELTVFAHLPKSPPISEDGEHVELLYLSLQQAQERLGNLLQLIALGAPLRSPPPADRYLVRLDDRYSYKLDGLMPEQQLQATVEHLLIALPAGTLLQICRAPRPRQQANCGRVFLSRRSAQQYCSVVCQQRAHHQRNQHPRQVKSA